MSFFFNKNKKPGSGGSNALPPASRGEPSDGRQIHIYLANPADLPPDIRSSDGPASQIPSLNGLGGNTSKPASPTPGQQAANPSINAIAENAGPAATQRPADDRAATLREGAGSRNGAPPSPEQKMLRDRGDSRETSRDPVRAHAKGRPACRARFHGLS